MSKRPAAPGVSKTIRGFTLLEVLIASSIFFAAIIVIAESYRVMVEAQRRAEATVRMVTPLPLLMSRVENLLRENAGDRLDETGFMLGVAYSLRGEVIRDVAPLQRMEPDTGVFQNYEPRFRLYEITIELKFGGLKKRFSYQELAWSPLRAQTSPPVIR